MPAGDKIAVSLIVGTQLVQLNTFMSQDEVIRQIEGPLTEADDSERAKFDGLNVNDQSVLIKVRRDKIDGYVIAPLVRTSVQPVQGRILQ